MAQKGFFGDGKALQGKETEKVEKRFDYNVWKNVALYDSNGKPKTKDKGHIEKQDYIITSQVNNKEVEFVAGGFGAIHGQYWWNVQPLKADVQYKTKEQAAAAIEKLYSMGVYGMFKIAKDLQTGKYIIHTATIR